MTNFTLINESIHIYKNLLKYGITDITYEKATEGLKPVADYNELA